MSDLTAPSGILDGVPEDIHLRVEIKNDKPVALEDFVKSFESLADEYRVFATGEEQVALAPGSPDVKLYVREIRTGSIITELVAIAPVMLLPFMTNANTIVDFAIYLRKGYDYLLGKTKEKPSEHLTKRELENFAKIVEPRFRRAKEHQHDDQRKRDDQMKAARKTTQTPPRSKKWNKMPIPAQGKARKHPHRPGVTWQPRQAKSNGSASTSRAVAVCACSLVGTCRRRQTLTS